MPASVRNAGDVVDMPAGEVKGEQAATALLTDVRASELKNARAVNTCKTSWTKVRKLWASKSSLGGPDCT